MTNGQNITVGTLVLVVLCLPAWAILNMLGPGQWLEKQRELREILNPSWLMFSAIYGFFISLITTPIAVLVATFFAIKAKPRLAAIIYVVLALSAVYSTLTGIYYVRLFMNLRFK